MKVTIPKDYTPGQEWEFDNNFNEVWNALNSPKIKLMKENKKLKDK